MLDKIIKNPVVINGSLILDGGAVCYYKWLITYFTNLTLCLICQGNELQIRQADLYLREGEELSFYEVLLRARQRREVMIGYRLADAERAVINPPSKSKRQRWSVKDVFVVIAEKE